MYKISKQAEYLKELTSKQSRELQNASALIIDQKNSLKKCFQLVQAKDELLANEKFKADAKIQLKDEELKLQRELEAANRALVKKEKRGKFWNGFAYGGTAVGILGALVLILK